LKLLPISINHLIELEKLPHHHRDPFDRLIIAQSIAENLTVISADPDFDDYPIKKLN
jgi:PIN domain nuclease of toxin-antitoxin system